MVLVLHRAGRYKVAHLTKANISTQQSSLESSCTCSADSRALKILEKTVIKKLFIKKRLLYNVDIGELEFLSKMYRFKNVHATMLDLRFCNTRIYPLEYHNC